MRRNFISTIFLSVFITATFTASFAQVNWTKDEGNPIMRSVDYAWDYHMMSPFVLKEGDVYKMWYTGINTFYRIGYATSSDGITWSRDPGNPIIDVGTPGSWDDMGLIGPQIIFDGSTYHMWYGGWDGTLSEGENKFPLNIRLGYATSSDGINWDKYPGNPVMELGAEGSWDAQGMFGLSVMYKDSLFHLWYPGVNGLKISIGYATSANGIDWEKDTLNSPVLEPGNSTEWDSLYVYFNNVLYNADSAQFEMWYAGAVTNSVRHIGFATSPDGINWEKYSNNPVMSPGPEDWDSHRYSGTHVMLTDEGYKMWYGGKGPTPAGTDVPARVQIGYATAPLGLVDAIIDKNSTPEGYNLKQNYPNPFNPTTTISYMLPLLAEVKLEIYNILGQKVETLVNRKQPAGEYSLQWDANSFASGVYYYKIEVGDGFVQAKKLLLIK
jgi:predicted GH43/DUF377 family glycosyl hydrolase